MPRLCPNRGVVLGLICRNRQDSGKPLIQSSEAGKDASELLYASSRGPAADFGPVWHPANPCLNDLAIVGKVSFCPSNIRCDSRENRRTISIVGADFKSALAASAIDVAEGVND